MLFVNCDNLRALPRTYQEDLKKIQNRHYLGIVTRNTNFDKHVVLKFALSQRKISYHVST